MAEQSAFSDSTLYNSTLAILKDLVEFDTTSRYSNLEIIDYIETYLARYEIKSHRIFNDDGKKANLFARLGPEVAGGYVFSGHTDVVPVDGQQWDTPPFILTDKGDALFGRGTADMKSYIAIALALVPYFLSLSLKKPLYFAFSYDEEVGCLGAPSLAKHIQTSRTKPDLMIVGEPTLMQVVNSHKGVCAFETVVTGLEAHSSNTHKGVNAVMIAADLIHFLGTLAEEYADKPPQSQFDPPYTSIHVGIVHGGTARNIIPKECKFNWEIRTLPGEDITTIINRFGQHCERVITPKRAIFPDAAIVTTAMSAVSGLQPDNNNQLETFLMRLTQTNTLHAVSFGTEAGVFQTHGIPTLICGPGSIEQAHKPNEFIEKTQITAGISFLKGLAQTLA